MIIVAYEANGRTQVDVFPSEKAAVFSRGGFVEVKDGHETIASYNPARFIMARKVAPNEVIIPAANTETTPDVQALHPSDGAEEQQTPLVG